MNKKKLNWLFFQAYSNNLFDKFGIKMACVLILNMMDMTVMKFLKTTDAS